jgi:adenylate cyclase
MNGFVALFTELRRRRVIRAAGVYVVGAWVLVQVASLLLPAFELPDIAIRYVWLTMLLLFPVALIVAWKYEIDGGRLIRTPPATITDAFDPRLRPADFVVIGALLAVSVAVVWQVLMKVPDMSGDTRAIAGNVEPNTIAVLPFENLSGDPEQQYFTSGMHGELISALSRINKLKVTSRTSTIQFRDTAKPMPQIGLELGVANLIEGSIYRSGGLVRISVALIDAAADKEIWSATFEDNLADVMALQNEVARSIARKVDIAISPDEEPGQDGAKAVIPAAFEALLKGNFHADRFTPQDMALAAQYYQQAIALDSEYAPAYQGLARLCGIQAQAGVISPAQADAQCYPLISTALRLDSSSADTQGTLAAYLAWQKFAWAEAELAYKEAIRLNPSSGENRIGYSHLLTLMGRWDEGSTQMKVGLERDPLNPFHRGLYGAQLLMIEKPDQAIEVIEQVMSSNPGVGFGWSILWDAYDEIGEQDEAVRAAATHFRLVRGDPAAALELEEAYADEGYERAWARLADLLSARSKSEYVTPIMIGRLYRLAGDPEKAIDWFELGFKQRDPNAPYLGTAIKSAAITSNPRFIRLLRDMGLDYWADKFSEQISTAKPPSR